MTTTEAIAQDIAANRAPYIEDMQDVYWYVEEVAGEFGRSFDREAVATRVAAILNIA